MNITSRIAYIFILTCIVLSSSGQTPHSELPERVVEYNQEIVPQNFDTLLFRDALLFYMNKELDKLGYRKLQPENTLMNATQTYASFTAFIMEAKTGLGGKKMAQSVRLAEFKGAAKNTQEFVGKFSIAKGKTKLNYDSVALAIVYKWTNGKLLNVLQDPKFIFCGVGACPDETGKKLYVTFMLGNYSTLNGNAHLVEQNASITTSTTHKLAPYDKKICKNTKKIKNIDRYQSDITVNESGEIFFETDEYKLFSKLLKLPTDAIAVDILSPNLYSCNSENIIDNSLPSKGYMLKPVYQKKIPKLNQITGKEARYKCKIPLGTLPSGINSPEFNLIVIQDKHACRSLHKTYTVEGETKDDISFEILADTITAFNTYSTHYVPEPDTTILKFRIPFELGKSDYNPDDIKPFIESLNEPDFIVHKLKITAYSSIEGEEGTNERLREMRANAIFDAFQKMNPGLEEADIISADSWSLFKTECHKTAYDTITTMERDVAVKYIKDNRLEDSLEHILSKQRFADIEMVVIYDISGVKERAFVLKKFDQALANSNLTQALSIEKYMMNKIVRRKYPPKTVHDIKIPEDSARFTGMEMNRLWLEYFIEKKEIDTTFYKHMQRMYKLSPQNDYIRFNYTYCRVLFDTIYEESQIDDIQRDIDNLLTTTISKEIIDPLNLKFQLGILSSINHTFEPTDEKKLVATILDKLKSIVELNDENWEQAMSLAYLFMDMKDYVYASEILEPFIKSKSANKEIVFTYLAASSNIDQKHHTASFTQAVELAKVWDKEELCSVLKDKFSLIVFENPHVKDVYCKTCFQ